MKKYISELLGTFVLVLVGCGTAVYTNADVVATSLAFGLSIVALAYSIGNVSGCHVNPAVSLAMLINKKMNIKDFIFYVISQIIGAFVATLVLGFVFNSFDKLGANSFDTRILVALIIETILTFIFILSILGVTSKKEYSNVSGLVIGLTLVLVHLLGIHFTGTSVNPARSIAPAILQGGTALSQLWVFIVAPLFGSLLASLFYKFVLKNEK
jgi:aquaporin Z